jgi:serine/threonine protein kinase
MSDENYRSLIEVLYRDTLAQDVAQRGEFLDRACKGDARLRREVESLLSARETELRPVAPVIAQSDESTSTASPSSSLDLSNQTLDGRYRIERKLGSGGIGDVYLASDKPELMSRRVVVKVLQEKALEDEWLVTKFRQEVEALTRIDDPGVVGLLDAGTLPNGHPYLVMQFVEGEHLRSFMCPDRGMDFEDVADLWQQVGRTLTAAHERDVIHRDLKPENIMVRRRPDGSWQVKVIDFGIAKIRNSLVAPSTVTARLAGTANYMSPEQLEGKKASAASDVYALGVIAYEMVTGRRPFNPETMFQLSELQKGSPLSPRALRPRLSPAAESVIIKALSYRVADRYQTARGFGDDLARALLADDEPLIPQPHNDAGGKVAAATDSASARTIMSSGDAPESTVTSLIKPDILAFSDAHPLTPETRTWWPRLAMMFAALLLIGIAAISAWKFWPKPLGPERSLTYWLTVQRWYDGKSLGQPFDATGRDYFHTGDTFALNIFGRESGALYLIDEGRDDKGMTEWNILFPTKEINRGESALAAQQTIKTGWYRFTGSTGVERVWMVWATQRTPLLDSIFRDAIADGVIHDATQQAQLQNFFKQYQSSPTELIQDETKARALLRGHGDVLVRRLDFSHKPNK